MLGISAEEFVVLLVVAAIVLGPERLPQYTQSLTRLVRELRRMAQGASEQVRAELGPEFDDVDWRKLDPRQYDPRRIVRDALSDTIDPDDPFGFNEPAARRRPPVSAGTGTSDGVVVNVSAANGSIPDDSVANGAVANGSRTGPAGGESSTVPGGAAGHEPPAVRFDPDAT